MNINIFILLTALILTLLILFLRRRRKIKIVVPLFSSEKNFATKIKNIFHNSGENGRKAALEEILLTADVGVAATEKLMQKAVTETELKNAIIKILTPRNPSTQPSPARGAGARTPFVIYLVGVNGVGKTTTIGKLAHQFKAQGLKVMLVAADTFRAAAVEQLTIWASRNDVLITAGAANADPASVIVDGLNSAKAKGVDVVLVDTAGRLHTKSNLMEELKKMVRMSDKAIGRAPDEIFLVVDAITGQNGFSQAKIFLEAIPVSGVILTKYDATSKGGIIIAIVDQTGIPIRYVGLGEGITDLKPFVAEEFVEKLFA